MSVFKKKEKLPTSLTDEIPRTKKYDYQGKLYESEKYFMISQKDAEAFNQLAGVILHDYAREGKLSKLSKFIRDDQVIDPTTKLYYNRMINLLETIKDNERVRNNLYKFHSLMFASNSPAKVLTNDLYKDHNNCVNYIDIIDCIIKNSKNKDYDFKHSVLYQKLIAYAKEVDNKYGSYIEY